MTFQTAPGYPPRQKDRTDRPGSTGRQLKEIVEVLRNRPEVRVELAGHAVEEEVEWPI